MVSIVHISDIHFKNSNDAVHAKLNSLSSSIIHSSKGCAGLLLALTGDIAFSGKQEEYNIARSFLSKLIDAIKNGGITFIGVIAIPGNHDNCLVGQELAARSVLISHLRSTQPDTCQESVITICTAVQGNFRVFEKSIIDLDPVKSVDGLYKKFVIEVDGGKVALNCFNSAWTSELTNELGTHFFPIGMVRDHMHCDETTYSVALIHHPPHWNVSKNYQVIRRELSAANDLVLSGHQHEKYSSSSLTEDNEQSMFLEAMELQNSQDNSRSGFSVVHIDLGTGQHRSLWFKWENDSYIGDIETQFKSFRKGRSRGSTRLGLNEEFATYLRDAGAPFQHPSGLDLHLSDLYVFPEIKKLRLSEQETSSDAENICSAKVLFDTPLAPRKVLIVGPEHSGKTTLCRRLFAIHFEHDLIPILVKGTDFHSSDPDSIDKIIRKCALQQYDDTLAPLFNTIDLKKMFIIVEDIHLIRMPSQKRRNLYRHLFAKYERLLLTADNLYSIREVMGGEVDPTVAVLEHFELLEFGNSCRQELIERWLTIGNQQFEDEEYFRRYDEIDTILESMVRRNLIPAFPLFLLTIIQYADASRPLNLSESAHADYYSMLITFALHQNKSHQHTVGDLISYCTSLSAAVFAKRQSDLTESEFVAIHREYCERIRVNWEGAEVKNVLKKSGILLEAESGIRFRYKFIYLFFLARHLSQRIDDSAVRDIIARMCDRLYVEDFANIILLLTHFTQSEWIILELLKRAKSIFRDVVPARIATDFAPINSILSAVPQMVLDESHTDNYRSDQARIKDDIARSHDMQGNYSDDLEDLDSPIDEDDYLASFAASLRVIEILGQLLINSAGTFEGPLKLDIGRTMYNLALRSVNRVTQEIAKEPDAVIADLRKYLEEQGEATTSESEDLARRYLFGLCSMIVYGILRRLASSVSNERLVPTFDDILEDIRTGPSDMHASFELVDIAVRLERLRQFPIHQAEILSRSIEKNHLAVTVLRTLVINRLHLYPPRDQTKQKVCGILGISVKAQRRLELKKQTKGS